MEKFDVIVVGAGPAGSAAAYQAAKGGASVLLIERGVHPGSKNVSGALVYARVLDRVFPRFWEQAPVERAVTSHQLVFLSDGAAVSVNAWSFDAEDGVPNAFTVHRSKFDAWLAGQAEAAGAVLITSITVDELLLEGDRVIGIRAGPDEIHADVVIVADGTKSLLLERADLRPRFDPANLALGVKEIIQLSEADIEARFNLKPGEGAAMTIVGGTSGRQAGGFLYTNRDTLSLGLVIRLPDLAAGDQHPHELLERFRQHPYVSHWTRGGALVEYSASTVHEGSLEGMPPLYGDGFLVAGSAAGLLVNNLFTFRGIDLAVESGALAAQTYLEARQSGDFSAQSLASYRSRLDDSFVLQDMRTFCRAHHLVENPRFVAEYPELICEILESIYAVAPQPSLSVRSLVLEKIKEKIGLTTALKDLWTMGRAL